jgi:hypothetical protein
MRSVLKEERKLIQVYQVNCGIVYGFVTLAAANRVVELLASDKRNNWNAFDQVIS